MRSMVMVAGTRDSDVAAQVVAQINGIVHACGVATRQASTHIYAQPAAVHVIAPADLLFLALNARALGTDRRVVCDFAALTTVLWGMLRDCEAVLVASRRMHVVPHAQTSANNNNNNNNNVNDDVSDDEVAALQACLRTVTCVSRILAALERPRVLPAVRRGVVVVQANVDVCIAVAEHLTRLGMQLLTSLGYTQGTAATTATTAAAAAARDDARTTLLRALPQTQAPLLLLLAALARHGGDGGSSSSAAAAATVIDARPILQLFASDAQWRASGWGDVALDAYCDAAHALALSLLTRSSGGGSAYDNAAEAVAQLLLCRVARRPPYCATLFRLFSLDAATRQRHERLCACRNGGGGDVAADGWQALGLLLVQRRVQAAIEAMLTPSSRHAEDVHGGSAATHAAARLLRSALAQQLRAIEQQQQAPQQHDGDEAARGGRVVLSYSQLLVLACVRGMPEADLTDDVALQQRARDTHLVHDRVAAAATTRDDDSSNSSSSNSKHDGDASLPACGILRLLLACAYTVSTGSERIAHATLSPASTRAVYDALAQHVLQQRAFAAVAATSTMSTSALNELFAMRALRTDTLVQLVLHSALTPTTAAAAGGGAAAAAADAATATGVTLPGQLLVAMQRTVDTVFAAAEVADAAQQQRLQAAMAAVTTNNGNSNDKTNKSSNNNNNNNNKDAQTTAAVHRTSTLAAVTALFDFFASEEWLSAVPLDTALDVVARLYALRARYDSSDNNSDNNNKDATVRERRQQQLTRMQRVLAYTTMHMSPAQVRVVLCDTLLPRSRDAAALSHASRLRLHLVEAYLRALATPSAAFAIADDVALRHWMDACLPAAAQRRSAALAIAAHDFLIAPMLAHKAVSVLFVPTYVALYVPTTQPQHALSSAATTTTTGVTASSSAPYGEPPLPVLRHFARTVRAACEGLERCDEMALQRLLRTWPQLLSSSSSSLATTLPLPQHDTTLQQAYDAATATTSDATRNSSNHRDRHNEWAASQQQQLLTPTNAALLVVAALFDKLCMLWNGVPGYTGEAQSRFVAYFSALSNLLQCSNGDVLRRVCASIEAVVVEHLRGTGAVQLQFVEHVGKVVDRVSGTTKRGVALWLLTLRERVLREHPTPSKL